MKEITRPNFISSLTASLKRCPGYPITINNPSAFPHPLHKHPEITCNAVEGLATAASREAPELLIHASCRSQTSSGSKCPSHISCNQPEKTAHTLLKACRSNSQNKALCCTTTSWAAKFWLQIASKSTQKVPQRWTAAHWRDSEL